MAVSTVASCGLPVRVVVLASASANRVIVVLGDKIHKYVGICGDNKIKYQIKPPANVLWWSTLFDCDPRRVQFNSYLPQCTRRIEIGHLSTTTTIAALAK